MKGCMHIFQSQQLLFFCYLQGAYACAVHNGKPTGFEWFGKSTGFEWVWWHAHWYYMCATYLQTKALNCFSLSWGAESLKRTRGCTEEPLEASSAQVHDMA